jgi:tetratricopeptide (TPR) repeat protein
MSWLIGLSALALGGAVAQPALVLGDSPASDCFAAARAPVATLDDVEACRRAVEHVQLTRADRTASWVNYGIVLRKRGQPGAAIAAYDQAAALSPDLAEIYLNRSAAQAQLGRDDQALTDLNRAIALGPQQPQAAYVNRALLWERAGEYQAAWRDLQAALAIQTDYAPALQALERYQVEEREVEGR